MNWTVFVLVLSVGVAAIGYAAALIVLSHWIADRFDLDAYTVGPIVIISGALLGGALVVGLAS